MVHNIKQFNSSHNRELLSSVQINQIDSSRLRDYIQDEYFSFWDASGKQCLACTAGSNPPQNLIKKASRAIILEKQEFHDLIAESISQFNLIKSKEYLSFISKSFVARDIPIIRYLTKIFIFISVLIYLSPQLSAVIFSILFFANMAYRFVLLWIGGNSKNHHKKLKNNIDKPSDFKLPMYTLLVPLYKEAMRVEGIVKALDRLLYPKTKLDVKLIIEEDDKETARAIRLTKIPNYIQIVKVPKALPRTKPKALNYAASFSKGEYIAIYDAEDEPDPYQLLKALKMFAKLPDEYACLQAKLRFYNQHESLLAYFINLEYRVWFGYILPALDRLDMPLPLGGTSNHFKRDILHKVGYWDAYNVTEDAELGLRLYLKGYKVAMLDSFTDEEAPNNIVSWLKQRTRWIKGFIKTSLIYFTNARWRKFSFIKENLSVAACLTMVPICFLCSPFVLFYASDLQSINGGLSLVNQILLFLLTIVMLAFGMKHNGIYRGWPPVSLVWLTCCWFGYFILHMVASYFALIELIAKPYWWHKTEHGKTTTKYQP